VEIKQSAELGKPAERYVPSTQKAKKALGLSIFLPIEEALQRTIEFYRG
jgi:hypothetical protein